MDLASAGPAIPSITRKRVFLALVAFLLSAAVAVAAIPSFGAQHATATPPARLATGGGSKPGGSQTEPRAKASRALGRLTALGLPIFCGAGSEPLVALTFDDGPGILSTEALATLRAHRATATFFLVGKLLRQPWLSGIVEKEARFGAAFGDHTWDHVDVTGATPQFLNRQIARTRAVIHHHTGRQVILFRPPLGAHDATLDRYVQSQGLLMILWSVDSEDSQGANADQIFRNVRRHLSPGDIILLHDNRGSTEKALPRILDLIDRRGYTAVTVPQLLQQDPPSNAQVRARTCS